ncbi:MAG: hypothetical protein RL577_933 [Bacteroidota bacterium]
MKLLLLYLGIFLTSLVKYAAAVAMALAVGNPYLGFLVCTLGGFLGSLGMVYGGRQLQVWWRKRRGSNTPRRRFTSVNRKMVWLRTHGGFTLIAFLSPLILSLPIGCALSMTFIHSRKRIVLGMWTSVLFWSLLLFGIQALGIEIYQD